MSGELILVVEDVELMRDILRETLLQEGFEVLTAGDGQQALDHLAHVIPDLIISDITMTRMDGLQFYEELRKHPLWDGIPFIFLTARTDPADMLLGRNLGVDDYLSKPIYRAELVTTINSRLRRYRQTQFFRLQQAYLESLITLANAIEERTPGGHRHIQQVTEFSLLIAQRLGWGGQKLNLLQLAAVLHDIGKIHISSATLFKAEPLDESEWQTIHRHPVIGAEMIKKVPFLADCAPFVRHHHEHWDGSGYPDHLVGEAIPDGARILTITDALASMLRERPYAPARTIDAAIQEIALKAGQRYDPCLVAVLQELHAAGEIRQ